MSENEWVLQDAVSVARLKNNLENRAHSKAWEKGGKVNRAMNAVQSRIASYKGSIELILKGNQFPRGLPWRKQQRFLSNFGLAFIPGNSRYILYSSPHRKNLNSIFLGAQRLSTF